ncbi:alanyl-tRNA synthetase [Beijerinckiaceae bacterium RH AL1]|nr:alanyl-tRNA synthetase [Beijerinckiaceae bacterium RH AL8]VVB43781.1 alanyl-tRNA synthetase [Beijerinckiaceae bacterium RH CH11]VVC54000.1 alanyl-tRNA synthetase [Beijerinckiaceae bacterium RH AL1]
MIGTGVNEIRAAFLDYFGRNAHEIVPSAPLVPRNDPSLMFTNAGMVPFKNVFTGHEKRPYSRATSSQKCVRAGGKHNDLDNVGYTARHHTFFEMLGNFSFGDYFKDVAIELAWTLITKTFELPVEKLLVTVYHDDDEAFGLWKKIAGLPESRIIRIATSDNFWSMGETGPCGPCSEIFYDQGEALAGGPPGSPDEDGDRFLEFWNLVFMQYEQVTKDERRALPRASVDTGMGLERIAALLQGVTSNYDIDLFRVLIAAIADATSTDPHGPLRASHRVIADHLRACAFLVADGVLPGNEGRGYVLRRIMRRAMRHAQMLGAKEPLMWRLVPALTREMGQAFPELLRAEALITETLRLEETRFRVTLARGLAMLDEETQRLPDKGTLPGEIAFRLYDTYGFPLDLTQDALRAKNLDVDLAGFDAAMAKQKADARAAWSGSGDAASETHWFAVRDVAGATDFLGYATERVEAKVMAILKNGAEVESVAAGDEAMVVLNQTPFYGESGGQVGDTGVLEADGMRFVVADTQKKLGNLFVHDGKVEDGTLAKGMTVDCIVDHKRRAMIRANHSATHLLHEALRLTLGDHIAQKGSLVAPERLRFDFSHPKPISADELARIEDIANRAVLENAEVLTRQMGLEEARKTGARALFGEKYGDEVRVVSMGLAQADDAAEPDPHGPAFSVELCGGTHVERTGDIGLITIVGESAVASGVRRVEAKTGAAARHHLNARAEKLDALTGLLKTPEDEAAKRLASLLDERKKLDRELSDARKKLAMGGGGTDAPAFAEIGGVKYLGKAVSGVEMKDLKALADEAKQTIGSGIVAIVGVAADGKAGVVVGVTEDLTARFDAVALVRAAAAELGGKGGGGRRDMAQAGGPDGAASQKAIDAIGAMLEREAA